ncbi:hypothetical protein ACFYPB_19350 [Streptomyces olivaceoviridis]|uniref:hypothetical protein n=1 Tax=Streptomyces olivaceoviridis TaxID=1921 RepID=UPI003687AD19
MTDLVERLVPDELWTLFRRVAPPIHVIRPQDGGRRRAGDHECPAAIVFVATSGCTWRSCPGCSGRPGPLARKGTVSWLAGCRRLHRRYQRKAEHFLAFVGLAALVIGYRRLARTIRA